MNQSVSHHIQSSDSVFNLQSLEYDVVPGYESVAHDTVHW
jgi:hypothetical protein